MSAPLSSVIRENIFNSQSITSFYLSINIMSNTFNLIWNILDRTQFTSHKFAVEWIEIQLHTRKPVYLNLGPETKYIFFGSSSQILGYTLKLSTDYIFHILSSSSILTLFLFDCSLCNSKPLFVIYSIVVTIYTTYFNIQNLCVLPSDSIYLYGSRIILKINSDSLSLWASISDWSL